MLQRKVPLSYSLDVCFIKTFHPLSHCNWHRESCPVKESDPTTFTSHTKTYTFLCSSRRLLQRKSKGLKKDSPPPVAWIFDAFCSCSCVDMFAALIFHRSLVKRTFTKDDFAQGHCFFLFLISGLWIKTRKFLQCKCEKLGEVVITRVKQKLKKPWQRGSCDWLMCSSSHSSYLWVDISGMQPQVLKSDVFHTMKLCSLQHVRGQLQHSHTN